MPYYTAKPARNSVFSDPFFRSFFDTADVAASAVMRVDVQESEDAYLMEVDLPGVKQEEIEITVNDDVLTISAMMNSHKKENTKNYIYNERRVGRYVRRFNLEGIAQDNITAAYENGTLSLNLPKVAPTKAPEPRKISIN